MVTDLRAPYLHFHERSRWIKVVAGEGGLEEDDQHENLTEEEEDEMEDEIDVLILEEENYMQGWWALPLPPPLAPHPSSAFFKLVKVSWPAQFCNPDLSDFGSSCDWHPRVSETSL